MPAAPRFFLTALNAANTSAKLILPMSECALRAFTNSYSCNIVRFDSFASWLIISPMTSGQAGVFSGLSCCPKGWHSLMWNQLRLTYLTCAVKTSVVLITQSCTTIGEPFRPEKKTRDYLRLADFPEACPLQEMDMHRCVESDFRCLISLSTLCVLLATVYNRDNVGDPPVMMSSHFH